MTTVGSKKTRWYRSRLNFRPLDAGESLVTTMIAESFLPSKCPSKANGANLDWRARQGKPLLVAPPHRPLWPLLGSSGPYLRQSFAGRPDAILFWPLSRAGVFQQARLISSTDSGGYTLTVSAQSKSVPITPSVLPRPEWGGLGWVRPFSSVLFSGKSC
jgi:hypothetical protein